jgi:hypothetical protein
LAKAFEKIFKGMTKSLCQPFERCKGSAKAL